MTNQDFLLKQITAQLREAKLDEATAISVAMAAIDHKATNPRISLAELLVWAKNHAKHYKRVKGKPDRPYVPGRRMGRR